MRVMFVCHGNICRSPMAEFLFKDMLTRRGVTDITVASSATSSEEIYRGVGNPVYPPARAKLAEVGISCAGKRARQLCAEDYHRFDLFIGMDSANIRNMQRLFGGDPQGKIRKLMEYTSRGGDVADPWYSGDFNRAFSDISAGCKALYFALLGEEY